MELPKKGIARQELFADMRRRKATLEATARGWEMGPRYSICVNRTG